MRARLLRFLLLGIVLPIVPSIATAQPAKEAPAPPRVRANDSRTLRASVGKTVTIYGKVSRTGKSSSGHNFLNFSGAEVTVACLKDDVAKFTDGAPADVYDGKTVEVTGKVELFKGKPQIKLTSPEQIKLVEVTDAGPVEPIELRKLDENHWLSPAGLHYRGKDPDGLTRLDHVLRHSKDDPERDGPHGVFEGGRDGALATIDAAWKLARERNTRPDTEGGRSAYTVFMGRDVGYLGGSVGARRNNPKLQRVLIVVERGTTNIVTAYPK